MGNKDLTEKILEDYNDVFADIMNTLLFGGKEYIKPNCLENAMVHSQYKADNGKLHEQERDIAKYWKKYNTVLSVLGIENQSKIDKYMPVRVVGYDGAAYRAQLLNNTDIRPVITIVLNFGERWNQPLHLKDIINTPDFLKPYINDWKIHVFDIAYLSDETINKFKSDFKIVARFFVERRKNKDYIPDDPTTITHVNEMLKLLSIMTGDNRYEEILLGNQKKEVTNMCEVAERLENIGKQKGRQEGRQEGERNILAVIEAMTKDGRTNDISKLVNPDFLQQMYKKYHII